MDLVVVGSVGLDDIETSSGSIQEALGGSAVYASITSSLLCKVGFVGLVGDDFPQAHVDLLASRGIDLQGLEQVQGKTFRWAGRYHADMNNRDTLRTELNVFEHFKPVLPESYRQAPYLFLGNIAPSLQLQVLDQAEAASFVAMDTMNFWIEGAYDDLKQVLERVDCLILNDEEARLLSGHSNVVRAARDIQRMGPRFVVIKRGEYGALIAREDDYFFTPAFPIDGVVDPTGAGDSFAGGFMGLIARQSSTSWATLCQATVCGTTTASFCVEAFSVEALLPLTLPVVRKRIDHLRNIMTFPMLSF